ncbi:MAG: hypothetical protein R3F17_16280 [Planctomycetota bacterium]
MALWQHRASRLDADRTTPVEDGNSLGSLLLVAHHADVAFGNIQVTPLP